MQIFIDESGNLGRGGEYFVISALIPENPKRIKNIMKSTLAAMRRTGSKAEEIKAYESSFSRKQNMLRRLVSVDDFVYTYVVVKKSEIYSNNLKKDKSLYFNYLARFLFRQIINNIEDKQAHIDIMLDNRDVKVTSRHTLRDYIKILAYTEWGFDGTISITYHDSKTVKNLQAADLVVNTIYNKYANGKQHLFKIIEKHAVNIVEFPADKF